MRVPHFLPEQILNCLKEIISRDKLYDEMNPPIVLCDRGMDAAFNMKAFHLCEIRFVLWPLVKCGCKTIQPLSDIVTTLEPGQNSHNIQ